MTTQKWEWIKKEERTLVFIDGSNLYNTTRLMSFDIDYGKLRSVFSDNCNLTRMYYFTAVGENRESSPVLGLVDWLDRNGYNTITKPIRTQYSGDTKGNIDIEIAVTMLRAAHRGYMDRAVLFSGDSDFRCLIEEVQNLGSKVTVVSTLTVKPIPCADELIRQADHFCDLDSLRSLTFRDPHATVRGNRRSNHDP